MMNNPQRFVDELHEFNANSIPEESLSNVQLLMNEPFFTYQHTRTCGPAAYLFQWVINIVEYNKIYKKVVEDKIYKKVMEEVRVAEEKKQAAEQVLRACKSWKWTDWTAVSLEKRITVLLAQE